MASVEGDSSASGGDSPSLPLMVRFPDARRPRPMPPPLKLEAEDAGERGMSPRNIWQVYALGGIMLLRWAWARWKERSDTRGPTQLSPPPPPPPPEPSS